MPEDGCVFCEIESGRAPVSIVYEDETALAFLDIGPVNAGHSMVIPRRHAAYLKDLTEDEGAHLFRVGMRVEQAIRRSGVRCEGTNMFLAADGEAAFQEIFHVHLHVFPRFRADNFRLEADWDVHPSRDQLDQVAAQIRAAFPV